MISENPLKVLAVLLGFLVIGQSCAGIPSNSAAQIVPSATASPLPAATPTSMRAVTSSPDSAAVIPTGTASNSSTSEPAEPTVTPDFSQMSVDEWSSTSPDGHWIAVGLVAFPKADTDDQQAYVRLMIFSADGKTHWTIVDEWREIGLGFPSPAPLKWSQDRRSFYFTYRAIPDGCPVFPYLTDLQQVNLESGSVADVLPNWSVALALSPDDSRVAYSYFDGQPQMTVALRDLSTGEEQQTTLDPGKQFIAGNIVWSPDGNSFALTLAIDPCAGDHRLSRTVWAESTTILVLDAETLQQKTLIQEDPRLYVTVEWKEPNKIVITDGEENSIWHLDVNTGEITRP